MNALRDAGADVWYDEHNLGAGRLGPTIENELLARPIFVVILSPAAIGSSWVQDETRWAYGLLRKDVSRVILPVTAAPISEDDIWLFLRDFKRIEAPGCQPYPSSEAARRTLLALALIPATQTSETTPPEPAGDVEDTLSLGKALVAQGKYAKALPLFERAAQLAPGRFDIWVNLGYIQGETGRWSDALESSKRACALNPTNAAVWNNLGSALFKVARYDEAFAAYNRSLALDPSNAVFWNNKANALIELRLFDEAIAACEQSLGSDPSYVYAWINKGVALDGLRRYEEALAAYDQAIAFNPKFVAAWDNKGEALNKLKRFREALVCLERALSLDANLGDAWKTKPSRYTAWVVHVRHDRRKRCQSAGRLANFVQLASHNSDRLHQGTEFVL